MSNRKNSNLSKVPEYYSPPIWLLRTVTVLFIAFSVASSMYLAYTHCFTSESLKDISEWILNLTFLLLGFNFSLTFLSNKIECDLTYKNNIKKFIFNAFFPLSISVFIYIFSYLKSPNINLVQTLACLGLFSIIYLITRSLVFMIINFRIDQLEK
jgi:hypothetical protein